MSIRKKQLKESLSDDIEDIIEGKGKGKYSSKDIKENDEEEEEEDDDEEDDDDEEEEDDDEKVKKEDIEEKYEALKKENENEISDDFYTLLKKEANLSEEFVKKSRLIFETALKVHTSNEAKKLEEISEELIKEKVTDIIETLTDSIDSYLDQVVSEYLSENELEIESGIKTQIAEALLTDIRESFEKYNVLIPENEDDLIEKISNENIKIEKKLDSVIAENIKIKKQLISHKKAGIIIDISENLADTETEKLIELAKNVDFEDEDDFREALISLKESYFDKKTEINNLTEEDEISKGTNQEFSKDSTIDPLIQRYVSQISKMQKTI